jgi:hypothetical protein
MGGTFCFIRMSVVYWLGAAITWIEVALTYRCWFCAICSLIVRQNEDLMAQPGGDILWSTQLCRIDQTSQAIAFNTRPIASRASVLKVATGAAESVVWAGVPGGALAGTVQ